MKVVWSPLAVDRVAEIASYIANDHAPAAQRWIRDLFRRVGQLARFPKSGHPISETPRPELRELIWGNYRILYRIDPNQAAILTVRHTKQILPLEGLK